ncbi:MAG: hypothetical protein H0X46_07535 [Bacteroidetes bacterium]|nr:hypothetical protein [Bacteroidota bacterium]
MKKAPFILFVSIGINSIAQNIIDSDITKPPSADYSPQIIPGGNNNYATMHGEYAYDTVSIWIINTYGFNEDPKNPGYYLDDKFDTLQIQRKMHLGYSARKNIQYTFVKPTVK